LSSFDRDVLTEHEQMMNQQTNESRQTIERGEQKIKNSSNIDSLIIGLK
jgi:hypothetical protein